MRSRFRGGQRSSRSSSLAAGQGGRRGGKAVGRRMRSLLTMAIAVVGLGVLAASASADGSVTLPGGPLEVSVGSLGECQSS